LKPRLLRRAGRWFRSSLRAGWRRWTTDEPTSYLAQSVDHVDLACRMRRWNEVERHDRTPLL
jgi:hypothetical protein